MNSHIKNSLAVLTGSFVLLSCGAPKIISTPSANIDSMPLKIQELNEKQLKKWGSADLIIDTIPGMSVDKAYKELIKNKKGLSVIVGVIDSGIDIDHEDLKNVIWTNEKEIPNNNIDDDNNGYVDDIHGWNFLGDITKENLEFTRIVQKLGPKYEGKTLASIPSDEQKEFSLYESAKQELAKEFQETSQNIAQYEGILTQVTDSHNAVSQALGKENYTKKELQALKPETTEMQQNVGGLLQMFNYIGPEETIPDFIKNLSEGVTHFNDRLNSHFKLDLNARAVLGDNVEDITDKNYGNNDVDGPELKKEGTKHGTHVAGIIAAQRNNNIGMDGVAQNVRIMALRAVPDGDEYDKDIALAIRYAVDNGAKVINASFGKYFSTHPDWVRDAIKYAASKDVLIVKAAGNEAKNLDKGWVYPNDQTMLDAEISDNFITVGALNFTYGSEMIANFSNYGKSNVDVFAPGVKIWSTTPLNTYEYIQGTSMASPAVAGIAALIRSYFPKLTAAQVKKVIMDSGISTKTTVIVAGEPSNQQKFPEISKSGKMVNLYNAFIMASKI